MAGVEWESHSFLSLTNEESGFSCSDMDNELCLREKSDYQQQSLANESSSSVKKKKKKKWQYTHTHGKWEITGKLMFPFGLWIKKELYLKIQSMPELNMDLKF